MLKESVKVDVAGMDQLYEILRYENVIDVRFTQIQEELTLFLLVAYFKQYYTYKKRVQRIVADDCGSNSSQSADNESLKERNSYGPESPDLSTGGVAKQEAEESVH